MLILFRTITLKNGKSSRKYKVEFGDLEKARVTITNDKKVQISDDLDSRDDTALFEAIFDGKSSVNVIKAKYDDSGMPLFTIGKLELNTDKIELQNAKTKKLKEIAADRYSAEVSGIEVDNIFFKTDRISAASLFGEYALALNDKKYSISWKTDNGFITLNRTQFMNTVKKVKEYIQDCFDKEKDLVDKINSASTIEKVNSISWNN